MSSASPGYRVLPILLGIACSGVDPKPEPDPDTALAPDTAAPDTAGDTAVDTGPPDEDCEEDTRVCRWTGEHGTSTADLVFYGDEVSDGLGEHATFIPDLDGDGTGELFLASRLTYDSEYVGAVAIFYGGRAAGGYERDADVVIPSSGFGRWTDWGDFDADGALDMVADFGGAAGARFGVGYFELARAGEAEIGELLQSISGDDQPFDSARAWRTGDATIGDVIVVTGAGSREEAYECMHLFRPPVVATRLEEHDIAVWTDEVWREASELGADVGDLDGDGHASFVVQATQVQRDADTLTGGVVIFDALPADGATLSDGDHFVWGRGADHDSGGLLREPGGDFDADGYVDLVLVDQDGDDRALGNGCVHVFPGPLEAEIDLDDAPIRICGTDADDAFGTYADATGDVDGDGRGDLLGGENDDAGEANHGRVRLFHGPLPLGRTESHAADATFAGETGFEVARYPTSGGDFDGDGADDILVGSPNYSGLSWGAGAAFLFYGRGD
jgi:hypothetical protein